MYRFSIYIIFLVTGLFTAACTKSEGSVASPRNAYRPSVSFTLRNKVVAHGGAWKEFGLPVNSLAALKKSIELGCGASELDVQLTSDKVLVVFHDPSVANMEVEKVTYQQLLQVKLKNGESIPTLAQYLKGLMQQSDTKVIIEAKPSVISKKRGLELADSVVSLVNRMNAQQWVAYASFDMDILKKVRRSSPDAAVQYISGNASPAKLAGIYYSMSYNYKVYKSNPDWIKEAKLLNVVINSWTVNDKEDMAWLIKEDIDMITTDYPTALLSLL